MMLNFTRFLVPIVMIFSLVPALLWFSVFAVAEPEQVVKLRDGDSFALNGEDIRLWGIDGCPGSNSALGIEL